MEKKFVWNDHGKTHSALYLYETYRPVAVITIHYDAPEIMDGCWRVMSARYPALNHREDISTPLVAVKQRTLLLLGNILTEERDRLEEEISEVLKMLFEESGRNLC